MMLASYKSVLMVVGVDFINGMKTAFFMKKMVVFPIINNSVFLTAAYACLRCDAYI